MTRGEREALEAGVFATVFDRERSLPGSERIAAALRAAKRVSAANDDKAGIAAAIELRRPVTELDEVRTARARKVVAMVALRRDLTSQDLLGPGRTAETVLARDEAAWQLSRGEQRMSLRELAGLFGRHHQTVREWIERHEGRVAPAAVREAKEAAHGR